MTAVQAVALALVALGGWAVVATRDPVRQVVIVSLYGITLTILFLAFQAPDVALSLAAVGMVALPLMIVLALTKVLGGRE